MYDIRTQLTDTKRRPVKYTMKDVEIDNRDITTTELVLPTGDRVEVTLEDCLELIRNMVENSVEE